MKVKKKVAFDHNPHVILLNKPNREQSTIYSPKIIVGDFFLLFGVSVI